MVLPALPDLVGRLAGSNPVLCSGFDDITDTHFRVGSVSADSVGIDFDNLLHAVGCEV